MTEEEAEPYLRLPDRITPEIGELAAGLADPGGDTRATLRNIERHLARNFTYNLEAGRTPAGADFVDTFLFDSREGYCVHFASAFTLLARLNGIPARYATGFLVALPDGSVPFDPGREPGRGTVSGLSSHAWPEVWLEGRGWTAWEATTAVNPSYYEQDGEDWSYEYGLVENRLTNRQLLAILGRRPVSPERSSPLSRAIDAQAFFLLIPAAALLWLAVWTVRRYGILIMAALRPDRSSAMKVVGKIVSCRALRGAPPPWECGWVRWSRVVAGSSPELDTRFRRLLRVIQRLAYGDGGFRRRDLRYLSTFYLRYCGTRLPERRA